MDDNKTKAIGKLPQNSTPSVKMGKNYILAIGIDNYVHHRRLNNAVADATGFAQVMTTRYGFEHLNTPLYNEQATQRNIRKALGKCEQLTEHDRLIVFYSGHGWYKVAAKLGYLVPIDAEDDPNTDFIDVNFITNIFKSVQAHHILLIVDCCFGGSFGLERDVSVAMTDKKIATLDTKKSRMVLSSGGIELVSDGLVADNNSPFSKPLIAILTENQAQQVAFSEFFNRLCTQTIWNTDQVPQYKVLPRLGHDDGELALTCTDLESPEDRAFNKAMETQSIHLLVKFLKEFPTSKLKGTIYDLLAERRAEEAWEKIKNSNHYEKFDKFIDDFPDSSFVVLAQQKKDALDVMDEEISKPIAPPPQYKKPKVDSIPIVVPKKFDFEPDMVLVNAGTFNRESQKVTLTNDFSIGKYPVTQAQWQAVMGNNPSHFKGGTLPVEQVSWDDCQAFIDKLNEKTGKKYRLPTEAEWEFAARGGNQSDGYDYSGSNNADEVAWYRDNSENKTHPVGTKKANELGIHDMSGNVWEWCEDWYGDYESSATVIDTTGALKGSHRVFRGGSWSNYPEYCRSTYRRNRTPTFGSNRLGFRLAISSLQ